MTAVPAEAVTAAFDAISMGWDIPAPETMKRILEAAAPLIAAAAVVAERERIVRLLQDQAPRYALGATALRRVAADLLADHP